jgi:hypothetical protein
MPEIDKDLAEGLKQAKARKMFFAFVPKGGSDGKLLLSKAKVPAKQIAEAKKEIGGGNAVTGKCLGPLNALVFQVVKPAAPALAALIKKVVKRDAGLVVDLDFQQAADADAEDEAGAGQPPAAAAAPPPPAGGDLRAEVMKRLNALVPGAKAALAGPNAARVQALLGSVNGLIKNNDFAQAGRVLDELAPLLAPDTAAAAPLAPPPAGADRAAVLKRLSGLAGAIKAALTGPNGARVQALAGSVNGLLKSNDFAQAGKLLDELEPLLGAQAEPGPAPEGKPRGEEPKASPLVGLQKARLAWTAAMKRAQGEMSKFLSAVAEAHGDDPRLSAIQAALARVEQDLTAWLEKLSDKLDAALNAGDGQRAELNREAAALAEEFSAHVAGDPVLQELDDNGVVSVSVAKTLADTLKLLSGWLSA